MSHVDVVIVTKVYKHYYTDEPDKSFNGTHSYYFGSLHSGLQWYNCQLKITIIVNMIITIEHYKIWL